VEDLMTKTERWIRTVYLYLFALLGLIFLSIGGIRLLDMGLRTYIFRQADAFDRIREVPPIPPTARLRTEQLADDAELTAEERQQVRAWLDDYRSWQERQDALDPVMARRHREAAGSLAMILVGLPLYLYHWRRIRIEAAERRTRVTGGGAGGVATS
jgi:hypothetical protein